MSLPSGPKECWRRLARTIAPKPGIRFFDEPLSNLEARLRAEMPMDLMRLLRATGVTTVYVTHDQIGAMTMATHVAVANAGRVEQCGTPQDLIDGLAKAFVSNFVGMPANNLIPVVKNGSGFKVGGWHMFITRPADEALAMFRAEALAVVPMETARSLTLELAEVSVIAGQTMVTGIGGGLRLT